MKKTTAGRARPSISDLYKSFEKARAAYDATQSQLPKPGAPKDRFPAWRRRRRLAVGKAREIAGSIVRAPANTFDEMIFKIMVARWTPINPGEWYNALTTLCDDLKRLQKRAA